MYSLREFRRDVIVQKKRKTTEFDRIVQGDKSNPLVKQLLLDANTPHIYKLSNTNKEKN